MRGNGLEHSRSAQERRLDPVIADLAAFVVVTEHPRAERASQHLGAETQAQQWLVFNERGFEPVDLASHPLECIVCAHRAAEYDDAAMVRERRR